MLCQDSLSVINNIISMSCLLVVFATGARDGNVMVWDIRCNRRSGHYNEPVNVISNAHTENTPGTPQIIKKKTRRSSSTKAASVSQHILTLTFEQHFFIIKTLGVHVRW